MNQAHLNHVSRDSYSLLFYFNLSKFNQDGENSNVPWHMYSHPFEPHLCPVLALSKYIVANSGLLCAGNATKLFPGDHQYYRFMKIFHWVIRDNLHVF